MMLFCEDCGEKNFIDPATITTDLVEFRCQACNYLNRVLRPQGMRDTGEKVSASGSAGEIMEKLCRVKGVTGAFIFHTGSGVTAKNISNSLSEKNLAAIAEILEKNYRIGQKNFRDVSGTSLYLKKAVLVLRKVSEDFFLILVCTKNFASDRLTEALDTAVDDLRASLNT